MIDQEDLAQLKKLDIKLFYILGIYKNTLTNTIINITHETYY